MSSCLGDGGDNYLKEQREAEEARQLAIRQGTKDINKTFGQFDNQFYNQQAKAYEQFAMPQLEDQRRDANNQLLFSLARSGTLDSSIRTGQEGELQRLYGTERQNILDQGLDYSREARTGVEDARGDLIRNLQATGDAKGAVDGAINRASILAKPPAYSPVTQLFGDFTSGLGQQLALERSYSLGSGVKPRYSTGLFNVPSSSVSVTG